jgi:hypothetical protein
MGANLKPASHCHEPQLPMFLQHRSVPVAQLPIESDSFRSLLRDLCGELGLERQQTALRWLLEQLESSHDLRHLIHLLLQEGEA